MVVVVVVGRAVQLLLQMYECTLSASEGLEDIDGIKA